MSEDAVMDVHEHLAGIAGASQQFADHAAAISLETPVITCPKWTLRELLAHQGMVHRWATAHVIGDIAGTRAPQIFEAEGLGRADPVAWFSQGAFALLRALEAAPVDLDAFVFLAGASAPREFWARRQCHETTIHAVDALSAKLGRMPSAHESEVLSPVAVDGIDELLTGFLPRSTSRLRSDVAMRIALRPSDFEGAWLVRVSVDPPVTTRHTEDEVEVSTADVTFSGTAVGLYLGLWNRGDQISTNDEEMLARWHELAHVTWG
ncbi:MAG: maleylpyruvate isomerase N-terminal domain-containing protein [Knoellia sp.]